ncbi:MAG: ABC transporter ATP-binding protein [Candidatus Sumerlaeota bacterium]|nr:ABC transporter ATP-binding protein [Candidatus Sumerlaeota bacterium]
MALVEIRKLIKIFGTGDTQVVALNGIDLSIEAGGFVGLMGPSGSGKSTLLYILAGIDHPTLGECRVLDVDILSLNENQLSEWRNANVGFIFQTFNLIPVLTAYENVELPLLLTALTPRERREHVLAALEIVSLGDRASHYPRQLSGGQEQRVGIARAIVTDPTLILADEPTGDLDQKSAKQILEVLRSLNSQFNKTIVMVTHDPMASHYATITRHLNKGDLLPLGAPLPEDVL